MKATRASPAKAPNVAQPTAASSAGASMTPSEEQTAASAAVDDRQTLISRSAYAYYEARGRAHGHELEDWLQAEAEFERMQGSAGATASQAH